MYFFDYGNSATLTADQLRDLPLGDADVRRFAFAAQFDSATTTLLEKNVEKLVDAFEVKVSFCSFINILPIFPANGNFR